MRLDMDCVRDVLLCIEENTGLRKFCIFIDTGLTASAKFVGNATEPHDYQQMLLTKYDNDKLIYHVHYCIEADLLQQTNTSTPYKICIADLTPKGHSFIENVRDNKVWTGVKGIAAKVGSKSLDAVIQIASNVITELIKAQFGLGGALPI